MNLKNNTFFASIIIYFNILLLISLLLTYEYSYKNIFLNEISYYLDVLLIIQTIFILSRKSSKENPFILLLSYFTTIYYSFRILTLAIYEHSDVLLRFNAYTPEDTNKALIFIIICNFALFFGFSRHKNTLKENFSLYNKVKYPTEIAVFWIFFILFLSFAVALISDLGLGIGDRFINILKTYTTPYALLFPLISFAIIFILKLVSIFIYY